MFNKKIKQSNPIAAMNIQYIFPKTAYNKRYNKIISPFCRSISIFISISLVLIVTSCGFFQKSGTPQSSSMPNAPAKNGQDNGNQNIPDVDQSKPPLFFLAYGFTADASCFDYLKNKLCTAFPQAEVIASSDVTSEETISLSIEQQAEKCYQALLKIPNIEKRPILLHWS